MVTPIEERRVEDEFNIEDPYGGRLGGPEGSRHRGRDTGT